MGLIHYNNIIFCISYISIIWQDNYLMLVYYGRLEEEQELCSVRSLRGLLAAATTVHNNNHLAVTHPVSQNEETIETVSFAQLQTFQFEWVKSMKEQICELVPSIVGAANDSVVGLEMVPENNPNNLTSLMQDHKRVFKHKTKLFRVKSIVSMHGTVGKNYDKLRFRVRWVGYTEKDDTLEPWRNLKFNSVLHSFLIAKGLQHMVHKKFRK